MAAGEGWPADQAEVISGNEEIKIVITKCGIIEMK